MCVTGLTGRLAKAANNVMFSFSEKATWPKQVKALLDHTGLIVGIE